MRERGEGKMDASAIFQHHSSQNDEARIHRPRGGVRRLIRGRREAPEAPRELLKKSSGRARARSTSREAHRAKHTHRAPFLTCTTLAAQKYNTAAKRVEGKLNVHIVREYARAVDSTAGCGEVHFNFCLKREPKSHYSLPHPSDSRSAHAR
jgi:hypothetical protein